MSDWWAHDHKPESPGEGSSATADATVWTLTKGPNRAHAVMRLVPGVGIELRFVWNDETRATQVYRNTVELAQAANAKRDELTAAGRVDAPPHWSM